MSNEDWYRRALGGQQQAPTAPQAYAPPAQVPPGYQVPQGYRLVPDQQPDEIVRLIRAHLDRSGFAEVKLTALEHSERPARGDVTHPFVRHVVRMGRAAYSLDLRAWRRVSPDGPLIGAARGPGSVRYVEAVQAPRWIRYYYEYTRPDASHELRTSLVEL